jgi:hypothetical protein
VSMPRCLRCSAFLAADSIRLGYRQCSPCMPFEEPLPPKPLPRRSGRCPTGLHDLAIAGEVVKDKRTPAGYWIRCRECRKTARREAARRSKEGRVAA